MSTRLLIVGCGLTGSVIGHLLKRDHAAALDIVLWDKARGAGGRMSTSRSPQDGSCTADLGAQYITATPKYLQEHKDFYNSLLKYQILAPLSCHVDGMKEFPAGTQHFVIPEGVSAVVKYFLASERLQSFYGHHLAHIEESVDGKTWTVQTATGQKDNFDIVVLTMPVPQILALPGLSQKLAANNESLENLKQIKYSSRYALCLFFDSSDKLPNFDWDAKYTWDHDTFRFISFDNRKRNKPDSPTALVFHTSIDFGRDYIDKNLDEVEPILMEKVKKLFPDLPKPSSIKCHKWRYSQVLDPHPSTPGCVVLSSNPLLVAAGDGFTHSNMDGCISSAVAAAKTISDFVVNKS